MKSQASKIECLTFRPGFAPIIKLLKFRCIHHGQKRQQLFEFYGTYLSKFASNSV